MIDKLSKYGTVISCKLVDENVATILITNNFSENAMNTLQFLNDCITLFPKHPILETCITEENFAFVVLTKNRDTGGLKLIDVSKIDKLIDETVINIDMLPSHRHNLSDIDFTQQISRLDTLKEIITLID